MENILTWVGNKALSFLLKKQELKNQKNIEERTHITKAQFDKEFEIYQELSETTYDTISSISRLSILIDWLPPEKEKELEVYQKRYNKAQESFNNYSKLIHQSEPFINQELCEHYYKFKGICGHQLSIYPLSHLDKSPDGHKERTALRKELFENFIILDKIYNQINNDLKNYLNELKNEQ